MLTLVDAVLESNYSPCSVNVTAYNTLVDAVLESNYSALYSDLRARVTLVDAVLESNYSMLICQCGWGATLIDAVLESNYSQPEIALGVHITLVDAVLESNYSLLTMRVKDMATLVDAVLEGNYSALYSDLRARVTLVDAVLESNYSMLICQCGWGATLIDAVLESNYSRRQVVSRFEIHFGISGSGLQGVDDSSGKTISPIPTVTAPQNMTMSMRMVPTITASITLPSHRPTISSGFLRASSKTARSDSSTRCCRTVLRRRPISYSASTIHSTRRSSARALSLSNQTPPKRPVRS